MLERFRFVSTLLLRILLRYGVALPAAVGHVNGLVVHQLISAPFQFDMFSRRSVGTVVGIVGDNAAVVRDLHEVLPDEGK